MDMKNLIFAERNSENVTPQPQFFLNAIFQTFGKDAAAPENTADCRPAAGFFIA